LISRDNAQAANRSASPDHASCFGAIRRRITKIQSLQHRIFTHQFGRSEYPQLPHWVRDRDSPPAYPRYAARKVRLAHGPDWLGGPSRLARLQSRLAVEDDGCVFAADHRDGAIALAWPLGYVAGVGRDGVVEIVNSAGEVVLREGDAFAAAGGLTPDDFDGPEKRHARDVHGREMFVIGLPVQRLEE
jgi:hypothetical protein